MTFVVKPDASSFRSSWRRSFFNMPCPSTHASGVAGVSREPTHTTPMSGSVWCVFCGEPLRCRKGWSVAGVVMADKSEWASIEIAYSSWLRAAREAARGGPGVVRAMHDYLSKNDLLDGLDTRWQTRYGQQDESGRLTNWQSTYFSQWEKGRKSSPRPSVPEEPVIRDALTGAVTALVSETPNGAEGWSGFAAVIEAMIELRNARRDRGGRAAQVAATDKNAHAARNLLAVPPSRAADLDPIALGLGSWAYDGDLPPYTPRTTDSKIIGTLVGGTAGLTVIVGPPKAGKSRSVLELLRTHLPNAMTWWVNPAPGSSPPLWSGSRSHPSDQT